MNDELGVGRSLCVTGSLLICLTWAVFSIHRRVENVGALRPSATWGDTEEPSVCLPLKSQSVNMTWSNNDYTFWSVYVCVCVRCGGGGVTILRVCDWEISATATGSLLWNYVPLRVRSHQIRRCNICRRGSAVIVRRRGGERVSHVINIKDPTVVHPVM